MWMSAWLLPLSMPWRIVSSFPSLEKTMTLPWQPSPAGTVVCSGRGHNAEPGGAAGRCARQWIDFCRAHWLFF
ncbi:hypothetical protein M758_2G024700 [Ceratodon purpureus]|uniref:Secreted protein n=1 Tax=Ceratodon purpureus TaxID=3225 RepID=A0A8T0IPD7_CERPU|nr:hypothetical protein KC19_2G025300 [Ceratodon purpureus]KAG0625060.1 hypothetical protein M758_2G024700 [Ceratodon purpureus]